VDLLERPGHYLAPAPVVVEVPAPRGGYVAGSDTRALGLVVVALGGGRTRPGAPIDPRVGLDRIVPLGTQVARGEALARVHAADRASAAHAAAAVAAAMQVADAPPPPDPAVIERMDAPAGAV
jgi:thymidine phosphorylase